MKVHEVMTGHPQSVAPDNTLVEAAGLMREIDAGALPVMDGDELAGMITDRDIVVRGVADGLDSNTAMVREVMSGSVEFATPEQEVEEAVRMMEKRQIRRLPVLDRRKTLVGIIALGDIAMSSNPAFGGTVLRDVSQPRKLSSRRRRLAQASEPARMPTVPGARRGPSGAAGRSRTSEAKQRSASTKRSSGARRSQTSRKSSKRSASKAGRRKER